MTGAVLFNAGCNEQLLFYPFSEKKKKNGANPSCRFREKCKKHTF